MDCSPTIAEMRGTITDFRGLQAMTNLCAPKELPNPSFQEPKPASVFHLCERCFRIEQKRLANRIRKTQKYQAKIEYRDVLIDWK